MNTPPTPQAVIFDCDGLLADTETPDFNAWQTLYAEHGLTLALETWVATIGIAKGHNIADHHTPLTQIVGPGYDRNVIDERRRALHHEAMQTLAPMPGVVALLQMLDAQGIAAAVASNSERGWVDRVLHQIGLAGRFAAIATADEVDHPKPAPDVYLLAARKINASPQQCLALEDSTRGLAAAVAAGMTAVAVPTALTRHMDWSLADFTLSSLAQVAELYPDWLAPGRDDTGAKASSGVFS